VSAMLTLMVKPYWVCYKLDETIGKPCSGLLASFERKHEYAWPAWQNGDVVTWKQVMESLLMGNVYNLYKV
jgi:hypothetical protein